MRMILVAAIVGLVGACGGELIDQDPVVDPEALDESAPAEALDVEGAEAAGAAAFCTGAPVECYCKSLKTEALCRTAPRTCHWAYSRCSPNWE
jgi:hypothetical protein